MKNAKRKHCTIPFVREIDSEICFDLKEYKHSFEGITAAVLFSSPVSSSSGSRDAALHAPQLGRGIVFLGFTVGPWLGTN